MIMEKPDHSKLDPDQTRFQCMIGVGGIGIGKFFALNGNHTLGREESRLGHFLNQRDYCKLHIISHYVQTLLGPQFVTIPVGKVGDDEWGHTLLEELGKVFLQIEADRRLLHEPAVDEEREHDGNEEA